MRGRSRGTDRRPHAVPVTAARRRFPLHMHVAVWAAAVTAGAVRTLRSARGSLAVSDALDKKGILE